MSVCVLCSRQYNQRSLDLLHDIETPRNQAGFETGPSVRPVRRSLANCLGNRDGRHQGEPHDPRRRRFRRAHHGDRTLHDRHPSPNGAFHSKRPPDHHRAGSPPGRRTWTARLSNRPNPGIHIATNGHRNVNTPPAPSLPALNDSTFALGAFSVRRLGYGAMQLPGPNAFGPPRDHRSEERRVGKECEVPCRSRWSPDH